MFLLKTKVWNFWNFEIWKVWGVFRFRFSLWTRHFYFVFKLSFFGSGQRCSLKILFLNLKILESDKNFTKNWLSSHLFCKDFANFWRKAFSIGTALIVFCKSFSKENKNDFLATSNDSLLIALHSFYPFCVF